MDKQFYEEKTKVIDLNEYLAWSVMMDEIMQRRIADAIKLLQENNYNVTKG